MRVQRGVRRLAVVFLGTTTLVPVCVYGQNATWLATPGSGAFSTATNWSPSAVPTGIASFGASSITTIGVSGSPTLNTLQFDAGASAYTFDVSSLLTLQGGGVVNNSSQVPTLAVTGTGTLAFTNSATAGGAVIANSGGTVSFSGTSSGGLASYIGNSGNLDISGLSSSGTALGSVQGAGSILLGSKQLTVGANNVSTTVGAVTDGGSGGGTGGSLVKVGTGTLILSNANSYTGGTTVSGGTLQGTTTSLQGTIVNNANVTFDQGTTGNYAGTMSGTGTLTKSGTGTVTLVGAKSYSGGTIVNGGILSITSDTNLGLPAGSLTLNGGTLQATAAVTSSRTVTLGAGGGTFDNPTATIVQLNGTVGGTGGLTKTGLGSLRLLGTNSYQGGTTISGGGTLGIEADANLGNAGGGLTLSNGSTVQFDANMSLAGSRAVTLGAGGGRFSTASGVDVTIGGGITGTGGLTKQGTGSLTLTGTNNYSGGTTVSTGTLQIGVGGGSAGSITGTMTVNTGAALDLTNAGVSLTTLTNGGTLRFLNATSAASTTITNSATTSFLGSSTAGSATITNTGSGELSFTGSSSAGAASITSNAGTVTRISGGASGGTASFIVNGTGRLDISGSTTGTTIGSIAGSGRVQLGASQLTVGGNNLSTTMSGIISDGGDSGGTGGSLVKAGTGTLTLSGANSYTGGTTVSGGTLQGTTANLQGNIVNNASVVFSQTITGTYASVMSGTGSMTKSGSGVVILTGTNSYTGGTTLNAGTLQIGQGVTAGTIAGTVTVNGGTLGIANANMSNTTIVTNAGSTTFANASTAGNATVIVNSGAQLQFQNTSTAGTARLVVNVGGTMATAGLTSGSLTAGSIEGGGTFGLSTKQLVVGSNNLSTEVTGNLQGTTASLVKVGTGTLTLSGNNTYTGGTTVSAGRLVINGTLAGDMVLGQSGSIGGSGTISGTLTNNGVLTPGNSIGTLTISGNYVQAARSSYQVEVNAAGQGDRVNIGGTGTIAGSATVSVIPQSGVYAPSTTYTILNAAGGVTGTYASVTSGLPFLQASLGYDSNNVYLTLRPGGFAAGAQSTNQVAVGAVLDRSVAGSSGDFATVIGTMSTLTLAQGQAAMDAISGQSYAGFSTANLGGGLMFMNVLGQQMSQSRGGAGGGTRVALAQACDVACDGPDGGESPSPSPWSLWGSALGGTGSVAGNGNASTLTYNGGGVATGADYRLDPRFLVGLGIGYVSGNQYLSGFNGRGTSDSYQASLYASFTQSAFYLDALAGYGYNDNQMTRQISISGLQPRTATGRTSASQFLGQAEAGYKFDIYEKAAASLTPFARFQATSVNQAGFSETGASSLNLKVAQQTTTSARSTLGAELAGAVDAGWRDKLALLLRLGWAHEYADTSRPVTASFAGAPGSNFTVFGAAPQRDAAVVAFAASTAIADSTAIYFRYDGEVGAGSDSHAFSAGLRMIW